MVQSIGSTTNPYQQYQLSYLYPSLSPAASALSAPSDGTQGANGAGSASSTASSDTTQSSSPADISSAFQQFDAALKAALLQFQTTLNDDQANQLATTSQATSSTATASANADGNAAPDQTSTTSDASSSNAAGRIFGHHHHHHHAGQAQQANGQDPFSLADSMDSTTSQSNPDDMITNLLNMLQSTGSGDSTNGTSAQDFLRAIQSYNAGQTPTAATT
jgi:hypothetical protein